MGTREDSGSSRSSTYLCASQEATEWGGPEKNEALCHSPEVWHYKTLIGTDQRWARGLGPNFQPRPISLRLVTDRVR
jgi:hypothetical protein